MSDYYVYPVVDYCIVMEMVNDYGFHYSLSTNDYTFFHVDEPNVIGINSRMVND